MKRLSELYLDLRHEASHCLSRRLCPVHANLVAGRLQSAKEPLHGSLLGTVCRFLEPLTQGAAQGPSIRVVNFRPLRERVCAFRLKDKEASLTSSHFARNTPHSAVYSSYRTPTHRRPPRWTLFRERLLYTMAKIPNQLGVKHATKGCGTPGKKSVMESGGLRK